MLASSPRSPIVSPLFLKGGKDSSIRWKEPFETRVKELCGDRGAAQVRYLSLGKNVSRLSLHRRTTPPPVSNAKALPLCVWSWWLSRRKFLSNEYEGKVHFDSFPDEKYTRLVFLKMTDSPGKMVQTIFYLDSKSKLFNSYATKSYASSLVLNTQKLKNNKKRRSSRFYSFRKTKFEILSNREMEIYHRDSTELVSASNSKRLFATRKPYAPIRKTDSDTRT